MSMNDLRQAFGLIAASRNADFCNPQSEATIARAEEALAVEFPPTYREFLRRLGCGDVAGFEVYGIVDDDFARPGVPNGIWLALWQRELSNAPRSLVFVSDTGDGGYYAIDVSRKSPDAENPVVLWWPGTDQPVESCEVVASDFGEFVFDHARRAIESWTDDVS